MFDEGAIVFAGVLDQLNANKMKTEYQDEERMRPLILDVTKDMDVFNAVKVVEESGLKLRAVSYNLYLRGWTIIHNYQPISTMLQHLIP